MCSQHFPHLSELIFRYNNSKPHFFWRKVIRKTHYMGCVSPMNSNSLLKFLMLASCLAFRMFRYCVVHILTKAFIISFVCMTIFWSVVSCYCKYVWQISNVVRIVESGIQEARALRFS